VIEVMRLVNNTLAREYYNISKTIHLKHPVRKPKKATCKFSRNKSTSLLYGIKRTRAVFKIFARAERKEVKLDYELMKGLKGNCPFNKSMCVLVAVIVLHLILPLTHIKWS